MNEWQPIQTAPNNREFYLVAWEYINKTWGMAVATKNDDGEWVDEYQDNLYHPTHWMPLPEPPK